MTSPDADRFWSRVTTGASCWEWGGARTSSGYGAAWWGGTSDKAHRVAWRLTHGEIPVGARVVQSCSNRLCVRPDHLTLRMPVVDDPLERARAVQREAVKGRGHLEARGPDRWRLVVYRGANGGEKDYVRRSFRGTEAEAQVALAELVLEVADGYHLEAKGRTFGEVLDLYYAHVRPSLADSTRATYRYQLRRVPEKLRVLPVGAITTEHLENFYQALQTDPVRPISPREARQTHQRIAAALAMAKRRRWIRSSPAVDVEWPNARRARRRRPSPAPLAGVRELVTLAREREGLAFAAFIRLAAASGGRRGELHGLRWRNVDFDLGTVVLEENVVYGEGGWIVKDLPKDDEPRPVTLGPATMALLREHYDDAFARALAAGTDLPRTGFVFSDHPRGLSHWNPRTTYQRFQRLCVEIGLPKTTRIHDLRAMMSTQLAEQGHPLQAISQRLGHALNSTTAVTLDHYIGRNQALDRVAAELLDGLLDGTVLPS